MHHTIIFLIFNMHCSNHHNDNHTNLVMISLYCILQIFKCFCTNELQYGKPVLFQISWWQVFITNIISNDNSF